MDGHYKVVFTGRLQPMVAHREAAAAIAAAYKLSEAKALKLVQAGEAKIMKKGVDRVTADRIAATLIDAGLVIQVTAMERPSSSSPPMRIRETGPDTCPKCAARAVEQGICRSCGIVAAKYLGPAGDAATPSRPGVVRAPVPVPASLTPRVRSPGPARDSGMGTLLRRFGFFGLLLIGVLVSFLFGPPRGTVPYEPSPGESGHPDTGRPDYQRPALAPNGSPWPLSAGYVRGYQVGSTNGYSELTVDNRLGSADIFIKLVSVGSSRAIPVRSFFIAAGRSFTLDGVAQGHYDLRFRNLNTGGLQRLEAFDLTENIGPGGAGSYSIMTLQLGAGGGNVKSYPLREDEF